MLYETIQANLVTAMKGRDVRLVGLLRMIVSQLKYKMIDGGLGKLEDETVVAVLRTEVNKRKESIEIFEKAGDLARTEQEKYELMEIEKYLPKLMDEAEVEKEVSAVAKASGKTGGQLIGLVMGKLKGKADGGMVARIVNRIKS